MEPKILLIAHVLEFAVEPSDTIVEAGQSAVLDCVVRASHHQSSVLTQWLDQDGQKLTFIGDLYRSQLTNGSLYITSVIEEQRLTGTYQCMASLPNVGSIISRTAKLSIASLSGFQEEPRDITVFLGQKAYFACRAIANPPPKIKWLKDERPLQIDELRMTLLPSGALEIDEVVNSDQGTYRCNASGYSSYKLSNKASLMINGDQEQAAHATSPTFIAIPQSQTVVEGQNVSLDCSANGNPNPIITWLKDGLAIDMNFLDSRFSLVGSTNSLRITNIQEQDIGTYQCRAENREDSLDASALIQVQVPPKFLKKPQDKIDMQNTDTEFQCSVYGVPEPKIQWFKDGEAITYTEYYKIINGHNLKINGLMVSDSGLFQCFAFNPAGNIQAAASLKVISNSDQFLPTPTTVVAPKKKVHPKNRNKKLPNIHRSDDPLYKQSFSLFSSLKSESSSKLGEVDFGHLAVPRTNSQTNNQGVYDPHTAFNSLKSSETNDNFDNLGDVQSAFSPASHQPISVGTVEKITSGLPGPPQDLRAPVVKARFIVLSWNPPDVNAENIQAYSVYYREERSDRERFLNTSRSKMEEINIPGLQPGRVYNFRVVAITPHGLGVSSEILTITTQSEEHVASAPQQFNAFATSPRTIHISWTPPHTPNGQILRYTVYYMETATSVEHNVDTSELSYDLTGLLPYTEYSIWVVAVNTNGPGSSSDEKTVRTFTDTPSEPPSNITFEPSSTNIVVRWEPPPREAQNGVILGYKLRYRLQGKKGTTVQTEANKRHFVINDLERGVPYQIRLWAVNVNGTGVGSNWYDVSTFEHDLDESNVPEQPGSIKVRPTADRLYVLWTPPLNQNVRVRNYILGWGKGIPDQYTQDLDEKSRTYIIERLEPNSEYVLSLRASNILGAGPPIYTTVRTQDEPPPEPAQAIMPPMGLKAQVLSSSSVVLYWTDPTLSKSQYVRDNRYYVVSYADEKSSKKKHMNVTDLNIMIDDLKPNTRYRFSVKTVKGRKESKWSMETEINTWELPPNIAPRDVDVHLKDEESQQIELTWQPPKITTGRVTGYVILYTDDKTKSDPEWQALAIKGDNHSSVINNLRPFTLYYFKVQARNSRGYGPFSNIVTFRTGQNSLAKLEERHMPSKDAFFVKISGEHVSQEEYDRAQKVWSTFNCSTLGEYFDLYLKTDVLLLADVFENFRTVCLKHYKLDPCQYLTSPSLSWDAMLRFTQVELELLTDIDMLHFFKRGIRGGISQCSKRKAIANNEFLPNYDCSKRKSYLLYLDATNLYGHSMSQALPTGDFRWLEKEEIEKFDCRRLEDDAAKGYVLEVDLEYPPELHSAHNDLPFCPENITPPNGAYPKLIPNLYDKKKYIIHYRNLKQCLKYGLKLKTIHRVLEFSQNAWLKPYIDLNTSLRNSASNAFERDLFKLLINAIFGKTMENVDKRQDVRLCSHWENKRGSIGAKTLIAKPYFKSSTVFEENLVAIQMDKICVTYDKPMYAGFCILDISKTVIYEFLYGFIKEKYGENAILLYTDTDSLILEIFTDNVYQDIKDNITHFDTSNYAKENIHNIPQMKSVIGRMKDEYAGTVLECFYGTGAKAYCIKGTDLMKKAKGISKNVIRNNLSLSDYIQVVETGGIVFRRMYIFKSELHNIYTELKNKIALSGQDDKRYVLPNNIETLAWGHFSINPQPTLSETDCNLDLLIDLAQTLEYSELDFDFNLDLL